MAGYRPKSLDELNDMYDKTISAEKAIIKATKQLHDATSKIVASELPQEETAREEAKNVEEISGEVDSLIIRFREEAKANIPKEIKKPEPPVIKEPPVIEAPQKITFEKDIKPEAPAIPVPEVKSAPVAQSRPKVHYSLEAPDELQQKANAKSEERTDLFNDYMKIMNDEDDDFFSKRESFKKKEKKKKHKKGLFFRHEPKAEELTDEAEDETDASEIEAEIEAELKSEENSDEFPVKEVIYSSETPTAFENLKVEFEAENEESEEEFTSFGEYTPYEKAEETAVLEDENEDEEEQYSSFEEEKAAHPDFDIIADETEKSPHVPEEIAGKTFEEFMNDSDDIFSFDPSKENTIPEYAKEQYYESEEEPEECFEEETDLPPKNKKGLVVGRVLLSIVLAFLCVVTAGVVGINTLLRVNTGNPAFDEKCVFTATQDYTNSNILEGDLVITEKRYANDGEIFAYINYTQQCFMFGKRNGSIVNDSGDVLFIAENDGERVLVLRDDTRGVVINTYPGIGNIVTVCTEYFIPLISAVLLVILIIILLLSFVFKDKEKAYKKMMKKMIKKGVISPEEEIEETEEDTNLFSTIE